MNDQYITIIYEMLSKYARNHGKDINIAWQDFLDYFLACFDIQTVVRYSEDVRRILDNAQQLNPALFEILKTCIENCHKRIVSKGAYDFFGELYESVVLSAGKAARLGQFYTPFNISELMARIEVKDSAMARMVSEPSCGSGRNVIALWQQLDKHTMTTFVCEDVDIVSVKMCALNMMLNNMYGYCICHDTLRPDTFYCGYAINETTYPFQSGICSVREIKREEYDNLISRMYNAS